MTSKPSNAPATSLFSRLFPAAPPSLALAEVSPANPWLLAGVCVALLVAVWAVFAQTAWFEFVNLDDDQYISNSADTQLGFTFEGIAWAWTHSQVGNWHPLTTMSFMLDWSLFRNNPGGYHVHNVMLHSASVILLFLLLQRLTGAVWLSAMVTALFAIHPLRAESVAWVTERKDVLSNVFFMLTLHAYVHYVARPSVWRYVLLIVIFLLGLMSKAMLVTLPVVMLLLDYWPLMRLPPLNWSADSSPQKSFMQWLWSAWGLLLEKLPLFAIAFGFAIVTATLSLSAQRVMAVLPLEVRLRMAPISSVIYLGQLFYPVGLAAHYPYTDAGPPHWQTLLAVLVLLAISLGVLAAWRKYPYLIVGWLWYVVTLLPVIGLVPGGNQLRADRYTCLTHIGLYIALCWWIAELSARWPQRRTLGWAAAGLVIAAMLVGTYRQTAYWRNSEVLWRHTMECTSDNFVAYEHLAGTLVEQANKITNEQGNAARARALTAEAKELYLRAIQLSPTSMISLCNYGNLLASEGKFEEAGYYYRTAVKANPTIALLRYNLGVHQLQRGNKSDAANTFREAIKLEPGMIPAYTNLASLLRDRGRTTEAVELYQQALEVNPKAIPIYLGLGGTYESEGNFAAAAEQYEKVLTINSENIQGLMALGDMARNRNKLDEAVGYYQQALEIQPDDAPSLNNLGDLYRRQQKFNDAIRAYERAVKLAPQSALIRYNLAVCYEQGGRASDAQRTFQAAWKLAREHGDRNIDLLLQQRFPNATANGP